LLFELALDRRISSAEAVMRLGTPAGGDKCSGGHSLDDEIPF